MFETKSPYSHGSDIVGRIQLWISRATVIKRHVERHRCHLSETRRMLPTATFVAAVHEWIRANAIPLPVMTVLLYRLTTGRSVTLDGPQLLPPLLPR
jgi:hypothetical protein